VKDPDSVDGTVFEEWVASGKGSAPLVYTLLYFYAAFKTHRLSSQITLHDGVHSNFELHDQFLVFCWVHAEAGKWVVERGGKELALTFSA
jgi:hypothetical protein